MKTSEKIQPLIHFVIAALFASGSVYFSKQILDANNGYGITALMIWMSLNIIPNIFGMMVGDNTNNSVGVGFFVCVAIQWSLISGYASIHLLNAMKKRRAKWYFIFYWHLASWVPSSLSMAQYSFRHLWPFFLLCIRLKRNWTVRVETVDKKINNSPFLYGIKNRYSTFRGYY